MKNFDAPPSGDVQHIAAALAIAFTAPASAFFETADKLADYRVRLVITGQKSKAEAEACTEKAWKEAIEIASKVGVRVESLLDAALERYCGDKP